MESLEEIKLMYTKCENCLPQLYMPSHAMQYGHLCSLSQHSGPSLADPFPKPVASILKGILYSLHDFHTYTILKVGGVLSAQSRSPGPEIPIPG